MDPVLIRQRLATLRPLRDSDGQPLLLAVLAAYDETRRSALVQMRQALDKVDFLTLKQNAHTLGGAAATLGMQDIFDHCKVLQMQAESEQAKACQRSVEVLEAACEHAAVLLEQISSQLEGPEALSETG